MSKDNFSVNNDDDEADDLAFIVVVVVGNVHTYRRHKELWSLVISKCKREEPDCTV
jgi:hypothetical protein